MNILVNETVVDFAKTDFPILISGAEKTGASFFSMVLLSFLFQKKEKVVFFSAYPQAKELFREQNPMMSENDAIIIDSGEEKIILEQLKKMPDLPERIVLFKNMDVYSHKLFDVVKDLPFIIFSGDIDKCSFGEDISRKEFPTKIFFSQPKKYITEQMIDIPKYCGKIISSRYNGIIKIA